MLEGLLWGHSFFYFPFQTLIHKIYEEIIVTLHQFFKTFCIWNSNFAFWVWILQRSIIIIKKYFSSTCHYYHGSGRNSFNFHNTLYLFFLIFSSKNWESNIQLVKNASERPHIYRRWVPDSHHYFWSSVKSTLNVSIKLICFISTTSKINNFNSTLVRFSQKNIFWFHITMNNIMFFHIMKWN